MIYTLMHKNISVVNLDIDEMTGSIQKIYNVCNALHLPIAVTMKKGIVDRASLNDWWTGRSIPASRTDIKEALEALNLTSTKLLLTKCLGLSLSDQYWIRPYDSQLTWDSINFFENAFSEDIGDILLGKSTKNNVFDYSSPDNTSDGCLKKRWKIIDGKRCLIKAGSNPFMQQPFNEVIAAIIAKRLNIPHVPYAILWDEDIPYCVCEDFITPETELITAWRIMQTSKKDNNTSVYRHYLNCCESLDIPHMAMAMEQMIVLDYIIANEDRHQNNFGAIRNADTLEWIGAAPIFDSGSSLGYNKTTTQIISGKHTECKPFKKSHDEQIKLVSSFNWIDFEKLNNIENDISKVFNGAEEYISDDRKNAIIISIRKRIEKLKVISSTSHDIIDDTNEDVINNFSKTYR